VPDRGAHSEKTAAELAARRAAGVSLGRPRKIHGAAIPPDPRDTAGGSEGGVAKVAIGGCAGPRAGEAERDVVGAPMQAGRIDREAGWRIDREAGWRIDREAWQEDR
jgi:hypothetical protein